MKKLKAIEIKRKSVEEYKQLAKLPLIVILDDIRSMHNVGSIFRTCDAFMVDRIILCGITATPPNREITKTALGATESVIWSYQNDISLILNELKNDGYIITGIEQTNESILLNNFKVEKDKKYAIILGNEITGLQDKILTQLDYCIEISQHGTKHSLNVSVVAGIVINYFSHKMMK